MSEELPCFVYLRCSRCNAWLAMYGLPTHVEPKLEAAAGREAGWVQRDGTWVCDIHRADADQ